MAARRPVISFFCGSMIMLTLIPGCRNGGSDSSGESVEINGRTFRLEVAADEAAIELGLMNRPTIPDSTGMLFIFPDAKRRNFWMKDCLSDIDLIFLDGNGRVTATHRMVTEEPKRETETDVQYLTRLKTYSSVLPAQFAIELPPGTLDQLNVRIEDKIDLDLQRLKALAR